MSARPPRYDVVVIGAGGAGLAASVAAARAGASTLLLERHGSAGGMSTAALVHSFCGLYLLRKEPGAVLANAGLCREIEQRMIALTGMGPECHGRVDVLPVHPVLFAHMADEMLAVEANITRYFHTELISVEGGAGDWKLSLAQRGGPAAVAAKVLVDASGDAVVAGALGKGSTMVSPTLLQRPAYIFGIRRERAKDDDRLRTAGWLVEGIRAGRLPEAARGIAFRASGREGEWFGTMDLTGGTEAGDYSPFDPLILSEIEAEGRRVATAAIAWLAEKSPGWQGAYISQWPARAGIRESRRWIGESVLTGADVLAGRRFDDEIGLATWPIELRETAKGPRLKYPEDNRPTGIQLSCLRPKDMPGIWVAGRCISCDHEAQASIRVMGTCFLTGEAAGKAAAAEAGG